MPEKIVDAITPIPHSSLDTCHAAETAESSPQRTERNDVASSRDTAQEMRISVVVPVLNEEARIGRCLRELARFPFHEVIVVDGGSSDATRALAAGYPGVQLLEAPAGRATQMNEGARRATGELLLFLHADVSLPPDAVAQIRTVMTASETSAGAFRTWTVADVEGRRPWWSPLLHLADLRSRYSKLPYGDQAIFVRRSDFWKAGGYPEIPLMEDLELSRRLSRIGTIRVAPANVLVSGRRFIERPCYFFLVVNSFPLLYRLKVPPRLLARVYRAVR
jgi:rSAM/selenodomain-associated transferase 2